MQSNKLTDFERYQIQKQKLREQFIKNVSMKTYAREEDGTTYYFSKGTLFGHPTNADGTCNFNELEETAVEDYAEQLTQQEIDDIKKNLLNNL